MEQEDQIGEQVFGERECSAEELQAEFNKAMNELGWTATELAERMISLGDYRPYKTILRGIHRAVEGHVKVSGEMLALVRQAVRYKRRLKRNYEGLDWAQLGDGSWTTKAENFTITLLPQTRGRWKVHLMHESGYSPPWPRWQGSLDAAKESAFLTLDNGINLLKEYEEREREELRKKGRIL